MRGFPNLDIDTINCHIGIKTFREIGHMCQLPSGTVSETTISNRGQPTQVLHLLEQYAMSDDTVTVPEQEPDNKNTRQVYMTVTLADF